MHLSQKYLYVYIYMYQPQPLGDWLDKGCDILDGLLSGSSILKYRGPSNHFRVLRNIYNNITTRRRTWREEHGA